MSRTEDVSCIAGQDIKHTANLLLDIHKAGFWKGCEN